MAKFSAAGRLWATPSLLLLLSSKGHLAPLPSQLLMGQDCDCPAQCSMQVPFDQWLLEIVRHAEKVTDSEELCAYIVHIKTSSGSLSYPDLLPGKMLPITNCVKKM